MTKMYLEPYDKSYLGLACAIPKSEQNKVVLCKLERHTGMLWWKKVEKVDVWGVTGVVEEPSYPHEIDHFWRILEVFDYYEKDRAYRFLRDVIGQDDE